MHAPRTTNNMLWSFVLLNPPPPHTHTHALPKRSYSQKIGHCHSCRFSLNRGSHCFLCRWSHTFSFCTCSYAHTHTHTHTLLLFSLLLPSALFPGLDEAQLLPPGWQRSSEAVLADESVVGSQVDCEREQGERCWTRNWKPGPKSWVSYCCLKKCC